MKKIYLVKKMYLCCTILSLLQLFSCADNAGKCYYVDASNGDDSNSGISASQAWKSLERVKQITLMPGEKLLLKR